MINMTIFTLDELTNTVTAHDTTDFELYNTLQHLKVQYDLDGRSYDSRICFIYAEDMEKLAFEIMGDSLYGFKVVTVSSEWEPTLCQSK